MTGNYKGWIELESCQLGSRSINSASANGTNRREAASPSVTEIVVTRMQDTSSPTLFNEALNGEGTRVTIDFVKPGSPPIVYMRVELENALIGNYNFSGEGGRPMESLSINFTKITFNTTVATAPPAVARP